MRPQSFRPMPLGYPAVWVMGVGVSCGDRSSGGNMKTDLYTKVALTVIALCLLLNLATKSTLISEAQAQQQMHVWIDGSNSYSLQYAGPISVKQ
jgi:hypothetical protein